MSGKFNLGTAELGIAIAGSKFRQQMRQFEARFKQQIQAMQNIAAVTPRLNQARFQQQLDNLTKKFELAQQQRSQRHQLSQNQRRVRMLAQQQAQEQRAAAKAAALQAKQQAQAAAAARRAHQTALRHQQQLARAKAAASRQNLRIAGGAFRAVGGGRLLTRMGGFGGFSGLAGMGGMGLAVGAAAAGVMALAAAFKVLRSAASAAFDSLMSITGAAIKVNAEAEQMQATLGVVLGSKERAGRLMAEIRKFAAETPFNSEGLVRDALLLKNYGFHVSKLIPTLKIVGDAAAASPMGMEHAMHRIVLAIGQMKSHGKLLGGELKQMAEAGVAAQEILQKHFGMSIAEIQKANKAGKISIDEIIDALLQGINKQFGGAAIARAKTWTGAIERMAERSAEALRQMTEPLFMLASKGLQNFADMFEMSGVQQVIADVRAGMESLAAFLSGVFKNVAPIFKAVVKNLEDAAIATSDFFQNLGGSPALMAAINVGATAFAMAMKGASEWVKETAEAVAVMAANLTVVKGMAALIIARPFAAMAEGPLQMWENFKVALINTGIVMVNVFTAAFAELQGMVDKFATYFTDTLVDVVTTLASAMGKVAASINQARAGDTVGAAASAVDAAVTMKALGGRQVTRSANLGVDLGAQAGGAAGRIGRNALRNLLKPKKIEFTDFIDAGLLALAKKLYMDAMAKKAARTPSFFDKVAGAGMGLGGVFGGIMDKLGGAAGGLRNAFEPKDKKDKVKADFVGLSELSNKIQLGLINSDEKKDRKAMVKGVNAIDMGVQAVKGAVDAVKGAIQNWVPKAI